MNRPAHKTEGVNRTQTMRFYPFVSTGKERDEEKERSRGPFASERGDEPRSGIPYCSVYSYTYFGARYMDHELMTMWLSVDPLADKYPSISPYAYCAGNPVRLVDPDGKEIYYIFKGKKYFLKVEKSEDGEYSTSWIHTDEHGKKETLKLSKGRPYIWSLNKAIKKLLEGEEGKKLVMSVVSHERQIEIKDGDKTTSSGKNGGINWNRDDHTGPLKLSNGENSIPNYIGLAHELAHVDDYLYDRCKNRDEEWDSYTVQSSTVPPSNVVVSVRRAEGYACTIENKIRAEHNLPLRTWYYYKSRETKAGEVLTFNINN